eukprot:scaffold105319_cov28-Tisochrysis_lutea.AAC.5
MLLRSVLAFATPLSEYSCWCPHMTFLSPAPPPRRTPRLAWLSPRGRIAGAPLLPRLLSCARVSPKSAFSVRRPSG